MTISSDISLARNYAYPNSKTLKNKYGIMDFKKLEKKCTHDAKKVIVNLHQEPLPEKFDSSYLKYLHKCLFEEAFEWAGHTRDLPFTFKDGTTAQMLMMKMPNSNIFFVAGNKIQESLQEFDQMLVAKNNLQGLSREEFIDEAAKLFSSLNYIHPFRGGNGPTQRVFFEKLAEAAGHRIDFSVITKERMIRTCINAIMLKGDEAHEAMKHLFEDISNPEKVRVLKELFNHIPRLECKRLDNEYVVMPREGMTYTGIYKGGSLDSIIVETVDSCVICHKDYLTPEQIKALKFSDEITFTVPINKDLDQILIPAEKLAPLREEEIIKKIENATYVQKSRIKIEFLSKLVYGDPTILDKHMNLINKDPEMGQQLAEQIRNSPKSISKLEGFKIGLIRSPKREVAERNISEFSKAIIEHVDIVQYTKRKILKEHQKEKKRVEQVIKRPSQEVQKILELQPNKWEEALKTESPEVLHKDLRGFLNKINSRLSISERKNIDSADCETLAESIGISDSKAKIIIQAFHQGTELYKQLEIIKTDRSKVVTMAI
ncbi:Bartonella effector protein (Bep), substrate of VirB T4SS [Bartonella clarridgeiae 73]|uniref:protein adenylyltransferase n=1 Tax=Bartonella clarridgeiae (strain CCUG 45776 / CIP 104772 / 73) TaxID=696125 RepID=E6YHH3_BARC7|nr:BID domain-containing T4SS effector [Bartonella clarridgeiae]WCR55112.1 MAG: Fic domain protein BH13370 type [Bartonella clarridgeiae]CBI76311.1 Bartonella effector protein (Bep), substrate of VirB T4SS [Bartonella clarridgeiae 73]